MDKSDKTPEPDLDTPSYYNKNGVDLELVKWMVSLTPAQRLDVFDQYQSDVPCTPEMDGTQFDRKLVKCFPRP